jgi:glucosyl-dolichyl phosphate glucuronosyltransferase
VSRSVSHSLSVAVVICAYTEDRWDAVRAAVRSAQTQTVTPAQVILVVDYNRVLFERCRQSLPGVTVLENANDRGLSGARNTGIAAATSDVVAFLDDDAIAAPDWVERLVSRYGSPRVVGVGGYIEPLWEAPRPRWFPDEFGWVVGCSYRGQPSSVAEVRNLIGANMSFRRRALVEVGGFRTDVGQVGTAMLRCDDTELCIRVGKHNPTGVLLHDPAVRVQHRVPAGRTTWHYFRVRCFTEGLAKALITRLVGPGRGLASERTYAAQTLPTGVIRALRQGLARPGSGGLGQAAAIVAGFGLTVAGYALARLRLISPDRSRQQQSAPLSTVRG